MREAWVRARVQEVGDRPVDMHLMDTGTWPYLQRLWARVPHDAAADRQFARRLGIMRGVHNHTKRARALKLPWAHDAYREYVYNVDWDTGSWEVQEPKSSKL